MNESWLSEAERSRLTSFPEYIPEVDLIAFFTLASADQQLISKRSGAINRLGVALQLCALRYMGFIPEDLNLVPASALKFLTHQLGIEEVSLTTYGVREQTRTDHRQIIEKHLGYRRAGINEWGRIEQWLGLRALEHDRPSFLLQLLCEQLQTLKFVRPGWSVLERAVASARGQAHNETWRIVEDQVKPADRDKLDGLLIVPKNERFTPLTRFRTGATSHSAQAILHTMEKIGELKAMGIARWDLSRINPNRLKMLAQKGRKATNQALGRMPPERRYPILLAFLKQSLIDTIDEAVDLYDRCLQEAYSRAGRELDEFRINVAKSANEKVNLFQTIGEIILDPAVEDSRLRSAIYQKIAPEKLRVAVDECEDISRPLDDSYFDLLGTRYSNLRQFAPRFLETFEWRAADDDEPLLEAITVLRELNAARLRKVPDDAPHEFIPAKWLPYVMLENGQYSRRYYELCLLWEIRTALRNGKLWIEGSRRYTDPETYLIPPSQWPEMKAETCRLMKVSEDGAARLEMKTVEFRTAAEGLARHLAGQDIVRIEDGELIVGPQEAEERSASCQELEEVIAERLPRIDLPALLIEVDGWLNFTSALRHAGGGASRREEILELLHASILAQSGNFGLTQMARMSGFNHQQLFWVTHWHLREETLREATTMMVNYHHHLPLSRLLGGGTLSSSDGQRFPVAVRTANATPLPRYYGYGRGLTFYTWTSDQGSQWGTKPIPSTTRDATFVLDEVLDNETELPLFTHATDTAGFTELIFCLFDLLGYQFAPRLRDLGDQTLCHKSSTASCTDQPTTRFRIVHPFHPLCGSEYELVFRRLNWGEDRVYFYDANGKLNSFLTTVTDLAPINDFIRISAGRSAFRVDDLLQLRDLLDRHDPQREVGHDV